MLIPTAEASTASFMHVGQLKSAFVNRYFADKYAGRYLLRLGDLGPLPEGSDFEDDIQRDLKSLGVAVDSVVRATDHLDVVIKYARRLIESGDAYMDTCTLEEVSVAKTAVSSG